jgi:hypothetical protein
MKRVLLAKEWTGMRPFVWLLVVLLLLDLIELGAADLQDLHRTHTLLGATSWIEDAVLSLLLAFAMGSGLLAREVEDGTLAFLDGLPVRRLDVFLAKLAVAWSCLFAYAVATPVLGGLLHLLLRHSIDEPIAASALGWVAVRYALLVAAGLALGVLFGFVRYLAWALLAVVAAAVMLLRSAQPRIASALDPTELLAGGWSTRGLGGDTLWVTAALTLACLLLAYRVFAGAGGAGMQRLARLAQHRAVVFVLCAAALVAVPVAIFQAQDGGQDTTSDDPGADDDVPVASAAQPAPKAAGGKGRAATPGVRKFVTTHYTFNIPAGRSVTEADLKAADAAFATAAAALSIEVTDPARIDVDLSGSIRHTAGLAAHNRIRITLEPGWHDTLVHETVHVMAGWIAGGEHARDLDRMSLFNEGLAHWAEPSYGRNAGQRAREQLALATLFRRNLLNQDTLLDNRTLERQLDWRLQYPLGAALIEVFVKRYGEEAPRRVLEALGRPAFPPELEGYELYRSAFQQAGFDLNLVLNDYALQLRRWSDAHGPAIDAMPRPRGLLVRAPGKAGIAVQLDRPLADGEQLVVQFRPRPDSRLEDVVAVDRFERLVHFGGRPVAWLPLAQVAGNQVCYQLGVRNRYYDMVEPWRCLPLAVAANIAF